MARLKAAQRNRLPAKDFAGPERSYPIEDENHARNALARVSQYGTPSEQARVRKSVKRKYPNMGKADEHHADARRHPSELHAGLVHDGLTAEENEYVHHDGGDHSSGQSVPKDHKRHDDPRKRFVNNPHGNPGFHPSTQEYEHEGYEHTSKHR